MKKEVEKPKYRSGDVVKIAQQNGFKGFRVSPEHVNLWKEQDAKDPKKGYGVEIQGAWFWYQSWVDKVLELCKAAGEKFKQEKIAKLPLIRETRQKSMRTK